MRYSPIRLPDPPDTGSSVGLLPRRPTSPFQIPSGVDRSARSLYVPKLLSRHTTLNRQSVTLPRLHSRVNPPAPKLERVSQPSQRRRFPLASIDLSRRDVGLPYGVPRRVNAATLKRIAGGQRFDRLLRKTTSGWEFVSDDTMIDLQDNSIEFKLGRLTIFS